MIEIRSKIPCPYFLTPSPPARYQYPLEEHARENAAEDARCLAMAEETIEASEAR